jgi:methylmalonyl-CoA carboxyltransferase 1.3S subunit
LKLQIGIDGNTYEVEIEVLEDDEKPHPPVYGSYGNAYAMTPTTVNLPPAKTAAAPEEVGDEDKICRSPVTGVVVKTLVEAGQTIAENELIMVIEAMKMETNVTAPNAGVVKTVRVAAGDAVKVNQVVVEFE